jgi:hypothetical protein
VVGSARSPLFTNLERGILSQFRHQNFLLFLIAHFQKAALLMIADRLVQPLRKLNISDPESVKRFKRVIRQNFEIFLRFTHRYWFHEVADQAQAKALFRLSAQHLGLDPRYAEVKERIYDMNEYLDSDSLRRQANTVLLPTSASARRLSSTRYSPFGENPSGRHATGHSDRTCAAEQTGFRCAPSVTSCVPSSSLRRRSDFPNHC